MEKNLRAAIICRVSGTAQDYKRQVEAMRLLCIGYILDESDIYADKISGYSSTDSRPQLTKLLNHIENGTKKYALIVSQEVSRLGRNPRASKDLVEYFAAKGIQVHVPTVGYAFKPDGKRNEAFHIIYAVFAEQANTEGMLRKVRSISGMVEKMKQGHCGAGIMLPFGYSKDENKKLILNPIEAPIVKEMFQMVVDGLGSKAIAHILNERKVPTKTQTVIKKGFIKMPKSDNQKSTDNMTWVDGTVISILKNPIHKGQRNYTFETEDSILNNSAYQHIQNYNTIIIPSPATVSTELFDDVQAIMKLRITNKTRETRYLYLLKGLLKCSKCGRNYVGRFRPSGKDEFYECSSSRFGACGNRGINISAAESIVYDVLHNDVDLFQFFNNGNDAEKSKSELLKIQVELAIVNKEIVNKEAASDKLLHMFLDGKIKEPKRDEIEKKYVSEIATLTQKQNKLLANVKSLKKLNYDLNAVNKFKEMLKEVVNDRFKMLDLFNTLLSKIIITSVSNNKNNNEFVMSVFFKGVELSRDIFVKIKQRNSNINSLVDEENALRSGQNRFLYLSSGHQIFDDMSTYSDDNILLNPPVEKLAELIKSNSFGRFRVPSLLQMDANNFINELSTTTKK